MDERPGAADYEDFLEFAETPPVEREAAPRWLGWGVGAVVALTVGGLVMLWPSSTQVDRGALAVAGLPSSFHSAAITSAGEGPCSFVPDQTCMAVVFVIDTGPDAGAEFRQEFPVGETTPDFAVGQTAVLSKRDPEGTIIEGREGPCSFDPGAECRVLRIRLDDDSATIVEAEVTPADLAYNSFAGDEVNLELFDEGDQLVVFGVSIPTVASTYQFADFQRRPLLVWLLALFAVAVVIVGRKRGLLALAGLAASVVLLLLFVVQGIVSGGSPMPIAVVGAAAIAIVTLYIAHGFTTESSVALLGVVGAIVLTAVIGSITLGIANVTGFASEEASLLTLFENVQVTGLLLAGVVLGAAGALDDVAITQAATVRELHATDPTLSPGELYERGMRVGRDHIASTVNTLLLAYAGASLPLLVLFVLSQQSLGTVANSEVVAVEVIRTVVGSFGLLATVPFTTWLAAMASRPESAATPSHPWAPGSVGAR